VFLFVMVIALMDCNRICNAICYKDGNDFFLIFHVSNTFYLTYN